MRNPYLKRRAAENGATRPTAVAGLIAPENAAENGATREGRCECGLVLTQACYFGVWSPTLCPRCNEAEDARQRAASEAARAESERAAKLKALDVPALYANATLGTLRLHGAEADQKKQARVIQLARRYLAAWPDRRDLDAEVLFPQVVIFRGCPGSGKGHVLWALAKEITAAYGDTVRVTVLPDLVRDLRDAWRRERGEASESARLAKYRTPDLLVIDEVSRHAFHGEPAQHLYDVVAWREQRLLPTILTTNESPDELAALIGPALESRAAAWSGVWDFGESDFRVIRRQLHREAHGPPPRAGG